MLDGFQGSAHLVRALTAHAGSTKRQTTAYRRVVDITLVGLGVSSLPPSEAPQPGRASGEWIEGKAEEHWIGMTHSD